MHTSNTDDTSREKLRHIIGACMCKDDDKSCWYTNNAQEVENDGTVQDNQVNAVLNLILQDRERAVKEAKLALVVDLEAKTGDGEWLSIWIENQYAQLSNPSQTKKTK